MQSKSDFSHVFCSSVVFTVVLLSFTFACSRDCLLYGYNGVFSCVSCYYVYQRSDSALHSESFCYRFVMLVAKLCLLLIGFVSKELLNLLTYFLNRVVQGNEHLQPRRCLAAVMFRLTVDRARCMQCSLQCTPWRQVFAVLMASWDNALWVLIIVKILASYVEYHGFWWWNLYFCYQGCATFPGKSVNVVSQ